MREPKEVKISDDIYLIHLLPPTKSLKFLTKLTKIIGGGAKQISFDEKTLDKDAGKLIGGAITGITERLDDEIIDYITNEIIKSGYVFIKQGAKEIPIDSSVFESHFDGKIKNLLFLIYYILEVNYKDFLLEAFGKITKALPKKEAEKESKQS